MLLFEVTTCLKIKIKTARWVFRFFLIAGLVILSDATLSSASISLLDALSGSWTDLDSFVTLGLCAGVPGSSQMHLCSPAQIPFIRTGRFEAAGFLSATESVLTIADTLNNSEINSTAINQLFSKYNYSEFFVSGGMSYYSQYFSIGMRPVRMQGRFQLHNPNLPLGSLTYRDDKDLFVGTGVKFPVGPLMFSIGAEGTLVYRKEVLLEASLVDFAAKNANELLNRQTLTGGFAHIGTHIELPNVFTFSALFSDIGEFWRGNDLSGNYLFILPDKIPRVTLTGSAIPSLWVGNFQFGAGVIGFLDRPNSWESQWFGTASCYLGPMRFLSGFRPGLLRTGLGLRFSSFEVDVAQEWINNLETGREAQPRFTLQVAAGI